MLEQDDLSMKMCGVDPVKDVLNVHARNTIKCIRTTVHDMGLLSRNGSNKKQGVA